jgi:Methyltransferase domain
MLKRLIAPVLGIVRRNSGSRAFVLRRLPRNSVGAEIGVYKGVFSQEILKLVCPAKLHLIDPWMFQPSPEFSRAWYGGVLGESQAAMDGIYHSVVEKFRPNIVSGEVEVHRGRSAEIVSKFPDQYFDWIYVDGDHRYEGVMQDLKVFLPKLKQGGFVAGDDYHNPGWWNGGVQKAVDEVLSAGIYHKVFIQNNQFLLRKPS